MNDQRSDAANQFMVGVRETPSFILSAEKTRHELQSQQNIYHPHLESSLTNSSNLVPSSNMSVSKTLLSLHKYNGFSLLLSIDYNW